jgi:hypothetical protein
MSERACSHKDHVFPKIRITHSIMEINVGTEYHKIACKEVCSCLVGAKYFPLE